MSASQYELAVMAAEMDATMMPGAIVEQDAESSRVMLVLDGVVVGSYPYQD